MPDTFQIGDQVQVKGAHRLAGKVGTVTGISTSDTSVMVFVTADLTIEGLCFFPSQLEHAPEPASSPHMCLSEVSQSMQRLGITEARFGDLLLKRIV